MAQFLTKEKPQTDFATSIGQHDCREQGKEQTDVSSPGQQDSTYIGNVETDSASSVEQLVSKIKEKEQTDSATSTGQQDYKEQEKEQTDSGSSGGKQDSTEIEKEQTDSATSTGQQDYKEQEKEQTDSASSEGQQDSTEIEKQQTDSATSTAEQDYKEQGKEQTVFSASEEQQDSTEIEKEQKDSASNNITQKEEEQTETTSSKGLHGSTDKAFERENVVVLAVQQDVLRSVAGLLNFYKRQQSKPIEVQFFVPIKTATTKDFSSNALEDLFGDTLFKCSLCGIGNLSENSPLVVVCPICSRFEPDIDCAIDGIDWKKTFVVLLLHSGLKSSIPIITTASKLAHMEKYKNIVFIDVAYTIDEKLYQCQMNENAKDQLRSFVLDFTRPNLD